MSDEQALLTSAYEKFTEAVKSLPVHGKPADYGWGNLPPRLGFLWMPYSLMFQEFSREIANSVNQLLNYAHRLASWNTVIGSLTEDQVHVALNEFIESMATIALNLPYVVRSRFIFATAHLSHQANRILDGASWRDDLPLDSDIHFETADRYSGRWKSYKRLKLALERISAKDYQHATAEFRHKYNHRFSPRVVVGYTGFVTRSIDPETGNVSYAFGEAPPMPLSLIAPLLSKQAALCRDAFDAFKELVREHEEHIRTHPMLP